MDLSEHLRSQSNVSRRKIEFNWIAIEIENHKIWHSDCSDSKHRGGPMEAGSRGSLTCSIWGKNIILSLSVSRYRNYGSHIETKKPRKMQLKERISFENMKKDDLDRSKSEMEPIHRRTSHCFPLTPWQLPCHQPQHNNGLESLIFFFFISSVSLCCVA